MFIPLLCIALALGFLGLTGYAIATVGLVECFAWLASSPAGVLAMVDLGLMAGCVIALMVADARRQRIDVRPYLLITMTTGSAGPLLYLARRSWRG